MKIVWNNEWPLDCVSARLNFYTGNILIAAAAYRYDTVSNYRAGGVLLYDLIVNSASGPSLSPLAMLMGPGVYNCTWLQDGYLAATFASGDFHLLNYISGGVASVSQINLTGNAVLTNMSADEKDTLFTCGDHSGSAYLIERTPSGLFLRSSWVAHKAAPTWASVFDSDRHLIYTCGDDNMIYSWDQRDLSKNSMPVWSLRGHEAGVCTVMPITGTNLLVSGSYDETMRVWDLRFHSPGSSSYDNKHYDKTNTSLDTLELGCGIWQVKKRMLNSNCYSLLCACLEGGAVVVGLDCHGGKLHFLKNSLNPEWIDECDTSPEAKDDSQQVYGVDFTPNADYFVACTHSSKNGTGSLQLYSL